MKAHVSHAPYYYARVEGDPDGAYRWLAELASADVDLLAFSAVPFGPNHVELTMFPRDRPALDRAAGERGWQLVGPYYALLIRGDDRLGALSEIHAELREVGVSVYSSIGLVDDRGGYSYLVYVREQDFDAAARVLDAEPVRRPGGEG